MKSEANEISRLNVNGKDIMIIDYSDCNENRMIEVLTQARKLIREENKPHRVLAIFNSNSYLTPKVMQIFNGDRLGTFLLERQATIGIDKVKKWIIEGNNVLNNNYIKVFETKQEAIDYLAGE